MRTYTDHARNFEEENLEVVYISTWPPSHLPLTLEALELELKGILVKKPQSDNAADGRRLLEAIKARNLPGVVHHNLLVFEHARSIIEQVRGGAIGKLKSVEIQCDKWDIINAGIHWMNFFVMLVADDPIDWVMAAIDDTTRTFRDGMQVETMAVTYAQTRSGVRGIMNTGDYVKVNSPCKSLLFRILGTDGHIESWGWQRAYRITNAEHPRGELREFDEGGPTGHQRHLDNLAAQIDANKPDFAVADSSLIALEICESAYLSHRHRCMVRFPLEQFRPPPVNDWDPGRPYDGQGGGRNGRKLPKTETDPALS